MVSLVQIRPKLKQDSVFIQTEEGVFLRSDENAFLLKGKNIYRWISTLSPYLTGQYSLDQLCENLEESQRDLVTRLVSTLLQRGILKNHVVEEPGLLPEAVTQHFRSQIEFIEHYTDYPLQKFKAFRESRLLLVGCGEAFSALGKALVANGAKRIFLWPTDGHRSYEVNLSLDTEALRQVGIDTEIITVNTEVHGTSIPVEDYDLVVYCSDKSMLNEIENLNRHCINAGVGFLSATICDGKAMLGPYVNPQGGPCWLCGQLRFAANSSNESSNALWRGLALGDIFAQDESPFFPALARRLGTGLGFEIFKLRAGHLPSETENGVIVQDLETLEAYRARLVSHPLCPICSRHTVAEDVEQLLDLVEGKHDRDLTTDTILQQAALNVDLHLGIWNRFSDEDIIQVPIKVSRIELGSPKALCLQTEVTAFSIDSVLEARRAALGKAITQYSRQLLDTRGTILASYNQLLVEGKDAVPMDQLYTWAGSSSIDQDTCIEWRPAYAYTTRSIRYVPAAAVSPYSALNRRNLFEKTSAGNATGLTFQELLTEGLLSALAYEQLDAVIRGRNALIAIEHEVLEATHPDLTFLIKSAQRFEQPFQVLKVADEMPFHTYLAFIMNETPAIVTIGTALSAVEAATKTLLDMTGSLQLWQAENKLPIIKERLFPAFSPYRYIVRSETYSHPLKQQPATLQQITDYVQARGKEILFVHMTPDDIWATEGFMDGVVLLTKRD